MADGGNRNPGSSRLALLVPLADARRRGVPVLSYDARNGRSKGPSTGHISHERLGLEAEAGSRTSPAVPAGREWQARALAVRDERYCHEMMST